MALSFENVFTLSYWLDTWPAPSSCPISSESRSFHLERSARPLAIALLVLLLTAR